MVKKRKALRERLKTRLRFSIYLDTSHEEIFFFRSSRGMVMLGGVLGGILIVGLITVLISFTPLRQLIPGYPTAKNRIAVVENAIKVDSLERVIKMWDFQFNNIQRILSGQEPLSYENPALTNHIDSILSADLNRGLSREDSLLRLEVIKQDRFNIGEGNRTIEQLEGLHMFVPVKGIITEGYSPTHPYIDIAAPANSAVSAILEGTVIMATYIEEAGYTIQIQHENNLISIYKHNTKLLKKTGDKVSAGTAIALIGDTGALSFGTHLHFELWHKGAPINPALYINF